MQIGALAAGATAKLAFDFEDAFTRISAISNASAKDIANWRGEVLQLSGQTAQSPKELADALFFLSSAGLESGQVMEALDAAAKGSAVGLGETADVANIVASALNAYSDSGLTAAEVTDTLVAAVREGRAEPEEFAQALGRILPIASEAGVTFDQVAASMAGLSNIGLDVNEGTTAMRGALQAIVAPGTLAAKAMATLGLSAQELLDSIQQDGLISALQLLKDRAKENTTGQADYLNILRQVIPNIRSLTGVLGLSGDALEKNEKIFAAVADAAGDLSEAFGVTKQGAAFQFRKALNDLVMIGTKLGQGVLPLVTGALQAIAPLLKFAASNAGALLTAFIGFKALKFIPTLLFSIAGALGKLGIAANSPALIGLGAKLGETGFAASAFGATLATTAIAGTVFAAALTAGTAALVAWDPLGILADQEQFNEALGRGTSEITQFSSHVSAGRIVLAGATQTVAEAAGQSDLLRNAFVGLNAATVSQREGFTKLAPVVADASHHLDKAGNSVRNFLNLTSGPKGTLKDFRQNIIEGMTAVAGAISDVGAVWTLSAEQAVKGVARMAVAQARLARDLQELDKIPVGDKLKAFLLEQGPQAVDAFVKGNKAQRGKIRDSFKVYDQAAQDTNKAVKDITTKGGEDAGRSFAEGAAAGTLAGSAAAAAAASRLGHLMVESLRGSLGISSPSKEGIKAGISLIDGITKGMEQRFSKIEDALRNLVPLIQKTLGTGAADQARAFLDDFTKVETKLRGLTREFDKLKNKIRDFRGAIVGGFSEFADLMGGISQQLADFQAAQEQFVADQAAGVTDLVQPQAPDISAFVKAQVAGARELAKKLSQLQKAGLSTANLAQLAGQGAAAIPAADVLLADPELIAQLNQAQQQIADITQSEADKLTNARFGDKVARLGEEFTLLQDHLDKLTDRFGRFIGALHVNEINDETQELVDALRQFRNMLENMGATVGAPSGGANVNGPPPGRTPPPGGGEPNITVNVNGSLVHQNDLPRFLRDALLDLQRRNVTSGL